jgi:hypothetical protein
MRVRLKTLIQDEIGDLCVVNGGSETDRLGVDWLSTHLSTVCLIDRLVNKVGTFGFQTPLLNVRISIMDYSASLLL